MRIAIFKIAKRIMSTTRNMMKKRIVQGNNEEEG
jgi:hypothetical protein